jgi:hypothetical protein
MLRVTVTMKKSSLIPYGIASLALVALLVVSALLWRERTNRFPIIPPGTYLGVVSGILPDREEVSLIAYRAPEANNFILALAHPEFPLQVIVGTDAELGAESAPPVIIEGSAGNLKFTGARSGEGSFEGKATNLVSGIDGIWSLDLSQGEGSIAQRDQENLKLTLKIKEEIENTRAAIQQRELQIPEQQREIERISEMLSEGEKLKTSAAEKLVVVQKELELAHAELRTKQDQAKRLEEKLKLSQQVTAAGRIVSLSRQVAEREGRWAESMMRSQSDPGSPEVHGLISTGARVLELQEAIASEKARINQLISEQGAG